MNKDDAELLRKLEDLFAAEYVKCRQNHSLSSVSQCGAKAAMQLINQYRPKPATKRITSDRNGDPLVGEVLDIIDRDNSRYKVAQGVAAFIHARDQQQRQELEAALGLDVESFGSIPADTVRDAIAKVYGVTSE